MCLAVSCSHEQDRMPLVSCGHSQAVSYEAIGQQSWANDRNRFDLMWKILETEPAPPPS